MKKAYVVTGIITVLTALGTQACTLGSDTYITAEEGNPSSGDKKDAGAKADSASSLASGPGAATCSGGTFTKPDVSKLTACGDGKGHCYPAAKTPTAAMFGACSNATETCVPDEVLAAGGEKLKSCTSIIGPGGCITMSLVPAMEADPRAKAALKQDVCDAGQICAPCTNPEDNNAPTPMCQPIGVFGECSGGGATSPTPTSDAGAGPSKPLPTCCGTGAAANGVCVAESVVPEGDRDQAPQNTCASGNLCIPKDMFEGKTQVCDAGFLGKGICLDSCFNEMMGFASMIGILGKCNATEACVPCTFMSGKGIAACD